MQEPTTQTLDWLAQKVVDAIRQGNDTSWVEQKRREFAGIGRLEVLRSLGNLDSLNLNAVCSGIGVSFEEMQATLNVLKKI